RRLVLPNDNIFDHAMGWHLYDFAITPDRHIPGLIVSSLRWLRNDLTPRPVKAPRGSRPTHLPLAIQVFERLWDHTPILVVSRLPPFRAAGRYVVRGRLAGHPRAGG